MSPEEFDNRLKSSFQDEFLPPGDQLWQNINQRLDQNAKKPFWYWFVPVLIVVSAGIAWIGNTLSSPDEVSPNAVVESPLPDSAVSTNPSDALQAEPGSDSQTTIPGSKPTAIASNSEPQNTIPETSKPKPDMPGRQKNPASAPSGNNPEGLAGNYKGTGIPAKPERTIPARASQNPGITVTPERFPTTDESFKFRMAGFPNFPARYTFEKEALVDFMKVTRPLKPSDPYKQNGSQGSYRRNFNNEDLVSKWWFELGAGPQRTFNAVNVKNDSQDYIHKDMWSNRRKLSHHGTGFQAHATLNYKFGKRFIFESGLDYSLRTEDIRFNETSFDIAYKSNGRITGYASPVILIIITPTPGGAGYDTTYYNAVANFAMAQKNKYHVVTIPFNVKSEHKLSENTFLSAGLGLGLSMISTSKSAHYDMIQETKVDAKSSTRLSGSLNASLGVYTNFNDYGQIGFYSGFRMYTQPWKVNNGQYAIRMSDLQIGVMFRKPLIWGK